MHTVIEHTPGYMPDSDELVQFDTLAEAYAYVDELQEQLFEEGYNLVDSTRDGWFVYSYYQKDSDDLGRIITIETKGE